MAKMGPQSWGILFCFKNMCVCGLSSQCAYTVHPDPHESFSITLQHTLLHLFLCLRHRLLFFFFFFFFFPRASTQSNIQLQETSNFFTYQQFLFKILIFINIVPPQWVLYCGQLYNYPLSNLYNYSDLLSKTNAHMCIQ